MIDAISRRNSIVNSCQANLEGDSLILDNDHGSNIFGLWNY